MMFRLQSCLVAIRKLAHYLLLVHSFWLGWTFRNLSLVPFTVQVQANVGLQRYHARWALVPGQFLVATLEISRGLHCSRGGWYGFMRLICSVFSADYGGLCHFIFLTRNLSVAISIVKIEILRFLAVRSQINLMSAELRLVRHCFVTFFLFRDVQLWQILVPDFVELHRTGKWPTMGSISHLIIIMIFDEICIADSCGSHVAPLSKCCLSQLSQFSCESARLWYERLLLLFT